MSDTLEFAKDQSGVSRVECRHCGIITEYFRYPNGVWLTTCKACQKAKAKRIQYLRECQKSEGGLRQCTA